MASAPTITIAVETLREVVEARVREEYEPQILAEVDRRQAAVEAALAGKLDRPAAPPAPEPPKPRRARSDKGTRRARLGSSPLTTLAGDHPATEETAPDATAPQQDGAQEATGGAEPVDAAAPAPAAPEPEVPAEAGAAEPPEAGFHEFPPTRERKRRATKAPEAHTPDAREPGFPNHVPTGEPTGTACSVCACPRCSPTPNGVCRSCGHREEYHQGRGAHLDPLGLDDAPAPGEPGDTNLAEQLDAGPDTGADEELGF